MAAVGKLIGRNKTKQKQKRKTMYDESASMVDDVVDNGDDVDDDDDAGDCLPLLLME